MKKTVQFSESVSIDRPAPDVWEYVANYANDLVWRRGVSEMSPNPPGVPKVGTTVHEVVTKLGSKYTTDSTVTETGPGLRYRFTGAGDSGEISGGRTVVGSPNGNSVFTYDITLHLQGFNALISPVVVLIMTRGLRKDLSTLSELLAGTDE